MKRFQCNVKSATNRWTFHHPPSISFISFVRKLNIFFYLRFYAKLCKEKNVHWYSKNLYFLKSKNLKILSYNVLHEFFMLKNSNPFQVYICALKINSTQSIFGTTPKSHQNVTSWSVMLQIDLLVYTSRKCLSHNIQFHISHNLIMNTSHFLLNLEQKPHTCTQFKNSLSVIGQYFPLLFYIGMLKARPEWTCVQHFCIISLMALTSLFFHVAYMKMEILFLLFSVHLKK